MFTHPVYTASLKLSLLAGWGNEIGHVVESIFEHWKYIHKAHPVKIQV